MKFCEINKLKNNEYIVLLPENDYDIRESVENCFQNVFFLDYVPTEEDAKLVIDFINDKANQLIIFDYCEFYRLVLPYIKKGKKIKWVYKNNLSQLTDGHVRATFTNLMEFYDRNLVTEFGCLDRATHEVLKKAGYRSKYIQLDIKRKEKKSKTRNSIGLIGNDYNPNHNTYNQLSALKMIDYEYIKILKNMPATKHFIDFFEIKEQLVETKEEVMQDNILNIYANFGFNNYEVILNSMDMDIPCLLGNTDFFDEYPEIKKYIVLDSDDDINEIAKKINLIKENKDKIMQEYNIFRENYIKKSIASIEKFLDI